MIFYVYHFLLKMSTDVLQMFSIPNHYPTSTKHIFGLFCLFSTLIVLVYPYKYNKAAKIQQTINQTLRLLLKTNVLFQLFMGSFYKKYTVRFEELMMKKYLLPKIITLVMNLL